VSPLEAEFAADGTHDLVRVFGGLRQIDEAHAVEIASHRLLLVRGERIAGDDEVLAAAEYVGDGGVNGVRVAARGTWPTKIRGERPGGGGRAGVVRAHQDDHHTGSIFQNAMPTFIRKPGRTVGAVL
jgi:hypothetical protein